MNLKIELNKENQDLLEELGINIENKEYSKDEVKAFVNSISEYIFSKSSKNGDISKATARYGDLMNILIANEK